MGALADLSVFRGRDSGGRNVGPDGGREKMNEAVGTGTSWKTAAMVLVAVLVLLVMALVSMLQPAPTTGASTPAVHPGVHATSDAGQGFAEDSYVERHAEVVAGYQHSGPR
jgi:hypothetical protein